MICCIDNITNPWKHVSPFRFGVFPPLFPFPVMADVTSGWPLAGYRWGASRRLIGSNVNSHDDVMAWECFPHYWAFFHGNPPVTDGFSPHRAYNAHFMHSLVDWVSKLLNKLSRLRWFDASKRWCDVNTMNQNMCEMPSRYHLPCFL